MNLLFSIICPIIADHFLYQSVVIKGIVATVRKFGIILNVIIKFKNCDESSMYSVSLFLLQCSYLFSLESFILTCSVTSVVSN